MNIITQEAISQFIFTTFIFIAPFILFLGLAYLTEDMPLIKNSFGLIAVIFLGVGIWGFFFSQSAYYSETVTEKTFTSFTITEGVDNTITVTGVDGDLKKSDFTFNSRLILKRNKKTNGQLKLELLEKDWNGKETVPVFNQQDYDSLRNEIINSSDFGKKYIVTYQKKRVVYKTNLDFLLQWLKNKHIPETDTEEFVTLTIKPKISVATK
jgi:hypothetical protein